MAQNVTIAGASYTDVTAIEVPKTTSGVASFHDVTDTTATASDVLSGKDFYNASGVKTSGSIATKSSSNLTVSGATVTAPAGYYASSASKSVASGSATTPTTTYEIAPAITVTPLGLITASNNTSRSITPTVTAGYVSSGTAGTITISGSLTYQLPTKAGTTYTPSTTNQTIASGTYLTGAQTIVGDANLVPANIAQGVSIFGVTGTHAGSTIVETELPGGGTHLEVIGGLDLSNDTVTAARLLYGYTAHDKSGTAITGTLANTTGSSVAWNDVNFYDYDGTRLYSYSAAEFASLTAMPPNPTHTGLTSQGWNWSLANAKTQVAGSGGCDIGQMYITSDGKTRLYITIDKPVFKQLQLGLTIEGTITIDWGDNSSPSTETRSGATVYTIFSHNYSNLGDYCISISVSNNGQLILTQSNEDYQFLFSYPNATNYLDLNYLASLLGILKKVELGNNTYINENAFYNCTYLESISIPNSIHYFRATTFYRCVSLKYITIPQYAISASEYVNLYDYVFDQSGFCFISLPDSPIIIAEACFANCRDLESIAFPSRDTQISSNMFQENAKLKAIHLPNGATWQDDIHIPSYFVYGAYALAKIVIPEHVTSIADEAFCDCLGLLEIHFRSSTPPVLYGSGAFGYMLSTDCKIYVPTGSLSAYTSATNYPDPEYYTYIEE